MSGDCRSLRVIQRVWPKHGWVTCTVMAWWYGRWWQGKQPILHIRLFRQRLELPLAGWGQTFPRTAHKCWGHWWWGAGTAPLLSDLHFPKSSPFCCGQIVSDMNPPQALLVQAMCKSTSLSVFMSQWVECRLEMNFSSSVKSTWMGYFLWAAFLQFYLHIWHQYGLQVLSKLADHWIHLH